MSTLDPNAWPHDNEPPPGDGPGVDDQAALAFEIAAMRVRASWEDLDGSQTPSTPPAAMAAAALDPFAPIVPAPASQPPPSMLGMRSETPVSTGAQPPAEFAGLGLRAAAPASTHAPAGTANGAASAALSSPSSAVDTAPMVFLQTTPVAAPMGRQQPHQTQDDLPSGATFLPQNRAGKPAMIAVAVAVVLGIIGLLASGGDDAEGKTPAEPASAETTPQRVVAPTPNAAAPGAMATVPLTKPQDARLAAATPPSVEAPPPVVSSLAARPAPAAPQAVVAPKPSAPVPETKSAESARRSSKRSAPAAQARAQRHESVSAARPSKRKPETARPVQAETPKRKGTGFVSANPY